MCNSPRTNSVPEFDSFCTFSALFLSFSSIVLSFVTFFNTLADSLATFALLLSVFCSHLLASHLLVARFFSTQRQRAKKPKIALAFLCSSDFPSYCAPSPLLPFLNFVSFFSFFFPHSHFLPLFIPISPLLFFFLSSPSHITQWLPVASPGLCGALWPARSWPLPSAALSSLLLASSAQRLPSRPSCPPRLPSSRSVVSRPSTSPALRSRCGVSDKQSGVRVSDLGPSEALGVPGRLGALPIASGWIVSSIEGQNTSFGHPLDTWLTIVFFFLTEREDWPKEKLLVSFSALTSS